MSVRQQVLLALLGLLALLRLVVVPWAESQNGAVDRLAALTMRLDRAAGLVTHRERLVHEEDRVTRELAEVLAPYPAPVSIEALRLAVQRELAATLQAEGLELGLFEWLWEGQESASGLAYGRVRLQTEGSLRAVARAHATLENSTGVLWVREAEVSMPRGGLGPQSLARVSLVLDYFYRPPRLERFE